MLRELRTIAIVKCRWTKAISAWLAKNPTRNAEGYITIGTAGSPEEVVDRTLSWLVDRLPQRVLLKALKERERENDPVPERDNRNRR